MLAGKTVQRLVEGGLFQLSLEGGVWLRKGCFPRLIVGERLKLGKKGAPQQHNNLPLTRCMYYHV